MTLIMECAKGRKVSKKRGVRDKYCLVCCTEFSYFPKVKWCHPAAVDKKIRKDELSTIKRGDKEAFLSIWEKYKESVGNYKIILHRTKRKTHSLCLDCAISFVMRSFEEFDDCLFKELKIDDFILCYKFKCDKAEKRDKGIICERKIEIKTLHLLFPPVPIGILYGFEQIMKLSKGSNLHQYDTLPYVIEKFTNRLLKIFESNGSIKRCVKKECFGTMTLMDEHNAYRWKCDSCRIEWCSRCNATHALDIVCQDFKCLTVWDDKTREMLEEEVNQGKSKHCPKCDQIIQKNMGCNHMKCELCETHFCWICLWVPEKVDEFTINPIYDHIKKEHL